MSAQSISSIVLALLLLASTHAEESRVSTADQFHQTIESARPGDVILLANGVWHDVELIADGSGAAAAPITIQAEQQGQVTISGNSRLRIAGSHVVVRGLRFEQAWHQSALVEFRRDSKRAASDCRLTDCEIIDCNPPDSKTSSKYLSLYGRHHSVDHCRFSGKTNRGTTLVVWLDETKSWGRHVIRNNHFGPRPELGRNEGETIRIGDSNTAHLSAKTLVEQNLFQECNGEGEIVSNKSCDNLYRKNVFLRCSGTLTLRHGGRCRAEQNLFLGQKARGTGGVRIIGGDHVVVNNYFERLEGDDYRSALCVMNGIPDSPANGYQPVERALVAHNTFVDCKRTILVGADNDEKKQISPQDCVFANNAIISRRGPMIDVRPGSSGIHWHANLCYGDGELGIEEQDGIRRLSQSPLKKAAPRWTLTEDSPLINAGWILVDDQKRTGFAPANLPDTDLNSNPRDQTPDVGCEEWPTDDANNAKQDIQVGPSWSSVNLLP